MPCCLRRKTHGGCKPWRSSQKKTTPAPTTPRSLIWLTRLERRVGIPERDGTGQRSRTRPHGTAIIAALHEPLAVLLADDLADVVTPDNDRADGRSTGTGPIMSPGAGEVVGRAGVAADLPAHIPAAPCRGTTRVVVTSGIVVVAMMVVRPSLRVRSNQTKYCRRSHDSTLHGNSLLEGRSRFGDQEAANGRALKTVPKRRGSNERINIRCGLKETTCDQNGARPLTRTAASGMPLAAICMATQPMLAHTINHPPDNGIPA